MKAIIYSLLIICMVASMGFAKPTLSNTNKLHGISNRNKRLHMMPAGSTPIFLNAADYGVVPTSPDNYAALVSLFNTYPTADIYLPPGNYTVNNTPGYMTMNHYSGHFLCAANAVIILTNPSNGGFYFQYGTGARLENITINYSTMPTTRTNNDAIDCTTDTNYVVKHIRVNGSPGVGLLFNLAINPQVSDIVIQNTEADGCSFYSCQNAQINNLNTHYTGDDGIAFFNNLSNIQNFNGATATNIIINNSKARGICVLGTSNVSISNFTIDSTSASGLYVAMESESRLPNNVHVSGGTINHGGVVVGRGTTGNQYGLLDNNADSVYLSDIHILNSFSNGLEVLAPNGVIIADNISVFKSDTNNVYIKSTKYANLTNIYSQNAGSYGFFANAVHTAVFRGITVKDAFTANTSPNDAIYFLNDTSLFADAITIIDDQPTATGYNFAVHGTTGVIDNIQQYIANGTFAFSITSSSVKTGLINSVPNGGTTDGVVYQGANSLLSTPAGTTGQFLGNSSGVPAWMTVNTSGTKSYTCTGSCSSISVSYTSPGYTPSNIVWTPTSTIGVDGWYVTGISSTGFTINYTTPLPSGTVTGDYTLVR
jgi:hypothetical protein